MSLCVCTSVCNNVSTNLTWTVHSSHFFCSVCFIVHLMNTSIQFHNTFSFSAT